MKIASIITVTAGAAFLLTNPALADHHEKSAGAKVQHPVSASHAAGATLWNYHGDKLGTIEEVYLIPGDAAACAVVETSILDDDRKIVVPWKTINVQTKKDDADDIIYALDADKAKLNSAPKYNGKPETMGTAMKQCCEYWDKSVSKAVKESAAEVTEEVKKAAANVKDAVKN